MINSKKKIIALEELRTKVISVLLGIVIGLVCEEIAKNIPAMYMGYYWIGILFTFIFIVSYYFKLVDYLLFKYHNWKRYCLPFKVAILSGYAKSEKEPNICKPMFCDIDKNHWIKHFKKSKNFISSEIHAAKISDKYTIIINPFGEVYQETDRRNLILFQKIKRYIERGGIFVCTGGLSFYYFWEPLMGRIIDTTPISINVNVGIGIERLRLFSDTLVTREFGSQISAIPSSPTPMKVFQKKQDKEIFGELVMKGDSDNVLVFRPVIEKSPGIIPALRVKYNDKEVYPLVAVSYGKGYLIISGMHVKTDAEFLKITEAIKNFCSYLNEYRKK